MRFIYSLFIRFFSFLIWLAAPFNAKARLWIKGRKGVFKLLQSSIAADDKVIWFHCASLGEFEQGRPVIEAVKQEFSDHKILLTFYSPSGYEVRKNYDGADVVSYLPADSMHNAAKFMQIVRPRIAFFIKYEFWFNYINQLSQHKVPIYVVSAIFRRSQYFFSPFGKWSQRQLQKITYFFVQNERSLALLRLVKVFHADISGDTRFDRVVKVRNEQADFPEVESFCKNGQVIVAGSTWAPDEELLKKVIAKSPHNLKLVIAPHVVSKDHIDQVLRKFGDFNPVLYSRYELSPQKDHRVLIIDGMGMLSYLYRFGQIAYIGGGFGVGIHNTLEAATYGIPVLFGPNYERFREAVALKELGCAFPVADASACQEIVDELYSNQSFYRKSAICAKKYVDENAGAVQKVMEKTKEYLLVD